MQSIKAHFTKDAVKEILFNSIIEITFEKADGSIREMAATLNPELLPQKDEVADEEKLNKTKSEEALAVWDTNISAWRSFRWDKLKTINQVEVVLET